MHTHLQTVLTAESSAMAAYADKLERWGDDAEYVLLPAFFKF
jgi:hypothetical protein